MGEFLSGPSGHEYRVNESNFRKGFPNRLQSYELTLLSVILFEVIKKKFSSVLLIGHYHHDNVLLTKTDHVKEVHTYYNRN